ncbi:histidine phosphatase family protein [Polaromonas sp.]|uniref:histidine phosphatase family protein n=1 Tax=Polaromonas sp. TaxID=1869339 RepID=UPI0024881C7C|nr:histidine phosphatase family protein [Polaromonas sp.]MDI1338690.1 histidine phosphatase family protein [Polaromonas sp.]
MTLWLVRHAQVLLAPGTCYGALDVAADPAATQQSATALAAVLPAGARILTSPLQRCEQLAQALIWLRPDLPLQTDARLQEMNFGAWEGRRWSDITRSDIDAWMADFAGHTVGGHGESVHAVMARVASAFDELPAGPPTVWITHAGIIRAAQLLAGGTREVTRADQWPLDATACGQWRTLELSLSPPPQ